MRKGIYTATVALVALVLAASMIAISGQTAALKLEGGYSNSALEVKREWQNIWSLFDKAASDAIADDISSAPTCNYTIGGVRAKAIDYFNTILAEFENCTVATISVNEASPGEITFSVDGLVCRREFEDEFIVEYSKSPEFKKTIVIVGASPCTITITDAQSGIVEVDV